MMLTNLDSTGGLKQRKLNSETQKKDQFRPTELTISDKTNTLNVPVRKEFENIFFYWEKKQ